MTRILLTGATGFIGARVARMLVAGGVGEVIAVGRCCSEISGVSDVVVPELSAELIERALEDRRFDGLIHLAAAGVRPADRDTETMVRVNTLLPACLVELAAKRGARAVVIAGSSAEYSGPKAGERLNEHAPVETMKLYGASKAAGGILALALGAVHGLPVGVVRLFNVYGPGEAPQRLLPTLVRHLKAGEPVPLSIGTQVRDFVHVDDACAGLWAVLCALAEGRMAGGPYNLATGAGRSVAEFARITARSMGAPESLLDFGAIPMHPDEIPFLVGDPTALNNAYSWGATRSLDQGIAAAVAELL